MKDIKTKICNYLKEGMYKKDAAVMAGISEATFYRWLEEDESFESQVEANILEYKRSLIQNVTKLAEKSASVSFHILKIRFPKEWGEPQLRSDDHDTDTKRIADSLQILLAEGHKIDDAEKANSIQEEFT